MKKPNTSTTTSERKLAAIVFADVAGYTALMQKNEEAATTMLHRFQNEMETLVAQHHGVIVNFYGDGALCTFRNPLEAVRCAMDIQTVFRDVPKVPVRIGIHSGMVVRDKEKIYGDSVNLTSRIESMGVAGGILFSERVRQDVKNQPDLKITSLGAFAFKNVEEPMEVYALANEGFPVPKKGDLQGKGKSLQKGLVVPQRFVPWLVMSLVLALFIIWSSSSEEDPVAKAHTRKQAIAVLPFLDLSQAKNQQYFSDGIAEEIIIQLSQIADLKVIARTSSFSYSGKNIPIKTIGKELGADIVVEGSVRRQGEAFSVNVRMIDTKEETLLWTQTFDSEPNQVMQIQRDVASIISKRLIPDIAENVLHQSKTTSDNFDAYDLYLKAKYESRFFNFKRSNEYLEECLQIDPDFAEAHALMAHNFLYLAIFYVDFPQDTAHQRGIAAIQKSLELDPENSEALLIYGGLKIYLEWDVEEADSLFKKAYGVNKWPETPTSFCYCPNLHMLMGVNRLTEAAALLEKVLELDPYYEYKYYDLGTIEMHKGNWKQAEAYFKEGNIFYQLPSLYILTREYSKIIEIIEPIVLESDHRNTKFLSVLAIAYFHTDRKKEFQDLALELEKRATQKEKFAARNLGYLYANVGEVDKAFDWLHEAYLVKDHELFKLKSEVLVRPISRHPRFQELLDKVGLK